MHITKGSPEHAADILEIRRQVRIDTYTGYAPGVTAEYIDELNQVTPTKVAAEAEKLADDQYGYWVVEHGGLLVAYQKIEGLPRQAVDFLHVLSPYRQRGLGSELLQLALDWFQSEEAFVEVTEGNTGARRLYERFGWQPNGEWIDSLPIPGGGYLREEVMVRVEP